MTYNWINDPNLYPNGARANHVWDTVALDWVKMTQPSGGGGGGGSVTQGTTPWVVKSVAVTTPLTPASANVTSTDSTVLAANASRTGLQVMNLGTTDVFIGLGTTALMNSGIMLSPNGTWVMDQFTYYNGAIHAICGSSSTLSIQEWN